MEQHAQHESRVDLTPRSIPSKKREPKEFFDFGERAIMGKHLERLINNGQVTFDGEVYRRN